MLFLPLCSGLFQQAGRREVAFTQGCRYKPNKPVQNMFKIRMVRKSEPEIEPVRKRTISSAHLNKKGRSSSGPLFGPAGFLRYTQEHFTTLSQYIRETLFSCRSACVFFFIFRHKLLNFNLSEHMPQTLFFLNYITYVFF